MDNSEQHIGNTGRCLNVLIAGHRPDRLIPKGSTPTETPKLTQTLKSTIGRVLDELGEALSTVYPTSASLRVLTGCSEGADSLAAEACSERGIPLHVLLAEDVSEDNDAAGRPRALVSAERIVSLGFIPEASPEASKSVNAFEPTEPSPVSAPFLNTAYATRDDIALTFSDLLIVVWDGKGPRGIRGGTVYLVYRALSQRKPVIWIDRYGNVQVVRLDSITDVFVQALDTYMIDASLLKQVFEPRDNLLPDYELFVRLCLAPWTIGKSGLPGSESLQQYLNELSTCSSPVVEAALSVSVGVAEGSVGEVSRKVEACPDIPAGQSKQDNHAIQPNAKRNVAGLVDRFFSTLLIPTTKNFSKLRNYDVSEPYAGFIAPVKYDKGRYLLKPPELLLRAFLNADVSANHNAGRHRSSIWLVHLCAALAVLAAVGGKLLEADGHAPLWTTLFELVLLVIIGVVYWRSVEHKWHGEWLSRRYLAEQFRFGVMGYPLLAGGQRLSSASWGFHSHAAHHTAGNFLIRIVKRLRDTVGRWWVELFGTIGNLAGDTQPPSEKAEPAPAALTKSINPEAWLLQYCYRQQGLPASSDGTLIYRPKEHTGAAMFDYVRIVNKEQQGYHEDKSHDCESLHERLHVLTYILFGLTFIAVLLHLVPATANFPYLLIATAAFPAFAAAVHGISTRLEFARVASQSHVTVSKLDFLLNALNDLERIDCPLSISPWLRWIRLRKLTIATSEVMSDENAQWADLLKHNEMDIPA